MLRSDIAQLVGGDDIQTVALAPSAAIATLEEQPPDALLITLDGDSDAAVQLVDDVRHVATLERLPVIVYASGELSAESYKRLKRLSRDMTLKLVRSPERLVDEVALFLHRPVDRLPPARREMIAKLHGAESVLAGKKILVVDDDIRNIFAMTSVLEHHEMQVVSADTGEAALARLDDSPGIDAVLMDIMMPAMDGYDTMQAIRESGKFASLPVIAITAKAMKGDRERCIEAGASDYIAKPVDTEHLLAMLRVWLHR